MGVSCAGPGLRPWTGSFPRSWRTCLEISRTAWWSCCPSDSGMCHYHSWLLKHTSFAGSWPFAQPLPHTPAFPSLLFLTIDQLVRVTFRQVFTATVIYQTALSKGDLHVANLIINWKFSSQVNSQQYFHSLTLFLPWKFFFFPSWDNTFFYLLLIASPSAVPLLDSRSEPWPWHGPGLSTLHMYLSFLSLEHWLASSFLKRAK